MINACCTRFIIKCLERNGKFSSPTAGLASTSDKVYGGFSLRFCSNQPFYWGLPVVMANVEIKGKLHFAYTCELYLQDTSECHLSSWLDRLRAHGKLYNQTGLDNDWEGKKTKHETLEKKKNEYCDNDSCCKNTGKCSSPRGQQWNPAGSPSQDQTRHLEPWSCLCGFEGAFKTILEWKARRKFSLLLRGSIKEATVYQFWRLSSERRILPAWCE